MKHLFSRFIPEVSGVLEPDTEQKQHISALRVRDGDRVRVFNGRGVVAVCVATRNGTGVTMLVQERHEVDQPEPLILAVAGLDHRDRFEFAVEKAVELGATMLVPLNTERVQRFKVSKDRIQAKTIAALTQSGNPWLPEISPMTTVPELLAMLSADYTVIVGDVDGLPAATVAVTGPVCCVVGPEGGFAPLELDVLKADRRTRPIAIGRLRLRAETAAIALLAVVRSMRG